MGHHTGTAPKPKLQAFIMKGHQPKPTAIAGHFTNNRLPNKILPIENSEIACIRLGEKPRLWWLITAKSDKLLGELKEKIRSKYDVAKFFLGALVVSNGVTLKLELWQSPQTLEKVLAGLGAFFALIALGYSAVTLPHLNIFHNK